MTHNFTPIYIPQKTESRDSDTCTRIFIPALFTAVKKWIQPKCPPTGERINKMWYIHTMGYYSTIKRDEILLHAMTWMNLGNTLLSEISQTQKGNYCVILLIWGTWDWTWVSCIAGRFLTIWATRETLADYDISIVLNFFTCLLILFLHGFLHRNFLNFK